MDDYENAGEDYSRAIEVDPSSDLYYECRADAYKEMGNYDAAKRDYQCAIDLGSDETR